MPKLPTVGWRNFARGSAFWAVTVILVAEIVAFYSVSTTEFVPSPPPLHVFTTQAGEWRMMAETPLDSETQEFLRADDTLNRSYADSSGLLTLFVAFFKSQRGGVTPHSPKVCLPGTGWTPESSTRIWVDVPDDAPLRVNRYLVRHGEYRSIVFYWYQTAHRVMADEYVSKAYLMFDGLRYHRSDEAIIRIVSPITDGEPAAEGRAVRFIQAIYQPLKQQMWIRN
jgi:EpsI family protein